MRVVFAGALSSFVLFLAVVSVAQDKPVIVPDCYCTDKNGDRIELGVSICLVVDGRDFVARCEMSLNNPMWREIRSGCLTAEQRIHPMSDEPGPPAT